MSDSTATPTATGAGRGRKIAQGAGHHTVSGGDSRWTLGLIPVALGLLVFFLCFWVAVASYDRAADATAVLGIVGTTIGAIVGAYFGVAVGSSGKDASDRAAAQAQDRATAAEVRATQAHHTALRAATLVSDPDQQQALLASLQ